MRVLTNKHGPLITIEFSNLEDSFIMNEMSGEGMGEERITFLEMTVETASKLMSKLGAELCETWVRKQ